MAFEATLFVETDQPLPFTVADGNAITKGAILAMSDPVTAAASSGASDVIAGIAAEDKIASDGRTKLAVYRRGWFKMKLSGSCTVGDPLATSSTANHVSSVVATANFSGAKIIGTALETGTTGETILVELNCLNQTTQL